MTNTGPALRIAARSSQDDREVPQPAAALISAEVTEMHAQWRRTIETVRTTLAGLEQACDSAIASRETEVAGVIQALVARAESERDEQQRHCQQQIAAAEAQAEALRSELHAQKMELSKAREQLEAAVAEKAKFQETFKLVQRALALGTAEPTAMPPEDGRPVLTLTPARTPPTVESSSVPDEQGAPAEPPAADPQSALMEAHPDVAEDITRVLGQVEAMYQLDLESGRTGIQIVESLTTSLRSARSLVATRWSSESFDAQALFEYQIGLMLEQQAGTAFGRHLGIAAYASRTPAVAGQP